MENEILDDGMQYDGLQITAESQAYLSETAKWAKFLAIVGFVLTGLMVLVGLFMGSIMSSAMSQFDDSSFGAIGGGAFGLVYVLLGLLYFFPSYYLLKFANKTKEAIQSSNSLTLTDALKNHKSVYKFMGILMIIILGFYALALIVGIGAAAFM